MNKKYYPYLIFITAVLFYIPYIGKVHLFDWDEINFAESAREMIMTGNYSRVQIDFRPFWEKPPLFFWLQSASMLLFGIGEFAARLPDAITGVLALVTLFFIGKRLHNEKFGLLWSLSYLGSFLPFLYFKSGIIDPVFNYFIFLSVFFIYNSSQKAGTGKVTRDITIGAVLLGLAVLTKGPVAILIIFLLMLIYRITSGSNIIAGFKNTVLFLIVTILISSIWFAGEFIKNGSWFMREFINYQVNLFLTPVAGHGEPFYYHFVVVFLGCFPISIWAIPELFHLKSLDAKHTFQKMMMILFWIVMILFSIVKTKIVHYSSLAYYPLSYLSAIYIYKLVSGEKLLKKYLKILLLIIGSLFSLLLITVPLIAEHKEWIIAYIKDPFAIACLNANVHWSGFEFLIGAIYLALLIMSIVIISKKHFFKGLIMMFLSTAACMFFYLVTVVPKIEGYSQAPAIKFYSNLAGKDVYVSTIGFKSYAQYFYFQKKPGMRIESNDENWLLRGKIDKPAYFVAKITSENILDSIPGLNYLYKEGGFIFYKRNALSSTHN